MTGEKEVQKVFNLILIQSVSYSYTYKKFEREKVQLTAAHQTEFSNYLIDKVVQLIKTDYQSQIDSAMEMERQPPPRSVTGRQRF
jgi:hypothetical protein